MAIDMEAIKEAVARRQGGGSSPVLSTQSAPNGNTPTGGPNTPTVQPQAQPSPENTAPRILPQPQPQAQQPQNPQAGKPQMKQVANFDEQTRTLAKALITKLMGAI